MSEPIRLVFIGFAAFYSCCAIEIAGAVPTFESLFKSNTYWFFVFAQAE
jgi:hypothetical protein